MFEIKLNCNLEGVKHMTVVKENIKKALIILAIYSIITLCLFIASERIQRLEVMGYISMQQIYK